MLIGIHETGLKTCELRVTEPHNSTTLPLPISGDDVQGAIESMLMDPEKDQLESGPVQFVRYPDAIVVIDKAGTVSIHWRYLYWLVQRPWG